MGIRYHQGFSFPSTAPGDLDSRFRHGKLFGKKSQQVRIGLPVYSRSLDPDFQSIRLDTNDAVSLATRLYLQL